LARDGALPMGRARVLRALAQADGKKAV
jgi:hypothetical protein